MKSKEDRVCRLVSHDAADWFIANREGFDAAQRDMFAAWLRTSPIHVEKYLGVALIARDPRDACADPGISLDDLLARAREAEDTDVRRITPPVVCARESAPLQPWLSAASVVAI